MILGEFRHGVAARVSEMALVRPEDEDAFGMPRGELADFWENQVRTRLPAGGKWIRTLGLPRLILGEEKVPAVD